MRNECEEMSAFPIDVRSNALSEVVERTSEIAALPQVVFKVVEMTDGSDNSAQMIERAIVVDPGFSAKILTRANSAAYGLSRRVTSIREAVMFLGFREIRRIALTVGMFDLFVGKTDEESLRRRAWWRQSVDTAVCCKLIAEKHNAAGPDEAYTCGLLHLTGKTLLDRHAPELYPEVAKRIEAGFRDIDAESEVYGCHHVQVGVAVAERWGFPEVLIAGLEYAYEPSVNDPFGDLMACVGLADTVATLAVEGAYKQDIEAALAKLPLWAVERLGLSLEHLDELVVQGTAAIAKASSAGF